MRKSRDKPLILELVMLCCLLTFTVAFYFIDPFEFLEKLGYSVIAVLSIIEALRIIHSWRRENE